MSIEGFIASAERQLKELHDQLGKASGANATRLQKQIRDLNTKIQLAKAPPHQMKSRLRSQIMTTTHTEGEE